MRTERTAFHLTRVISISTNFHFYMPGRGVFCSDTSRHTRIVKFTEVVRRAKSRAFLFSTTMLCVMKVVGGLEFKPSSGYIRYCWSSPTGWKGIWSLTLETSCRFDVPSRYSVDLHTTDARELFRKIVERTSVVVQVGVMRDSPLACFSQTDRTVVS